MTEVQNIYKSHHPGITNIFVYILLGLFCVNFLHEFLSNVHMCLLSANTPHKHRHEFFVDSVSCQWVCHFQWVPMDLPISRDGQHHYSLKLGILLRIIRVTWIQALEYCDSWSDNQNSYLVTNGWLVYTAWIYWTMGWFISGCDEPKMKSMVCFGICRLPQVKEELESLPKSLDLILNI